MAVWLRTGNHVVCARILTPNPRPCLRPTSSPGKTDGMQRKPANSSQLTLSAAWNQGVGVAGALSISEITVKAHRGRVMRKMKADSLADLVTMAVCLGLKAAMPPEDIFERREWDIHTNRFPSHRCASDRVTKRVARGM